MRRTAALALAGLALTTMTTCATPPGPHKLVSGPVYVVAYDESGQRIEEDNPAWNCAEHGNLKCSQG